LTFTSLWPFADSRSSITFDIAAMIAAKARARPTAPAPDRSEHGEGRIS
jgi:hypothetical protein